MPANTEREELHRRIWSIADDLRGSVDDLLGDGDVNITLELN